MNSKQALWINIRQAQSARLGFGPIPPAGPSAQCWESIFDFSTDLGWWFLESRWPDSLKDRGMKLEKSSLIKLWSSSWLEVQEGFIVLCPDYDQSVSKQIIDAIDKGVAGEIIAIGGLNCSKEERQRIAKAHEEAQAFDYCLKKSSRLAKKGI